MYNFKKNVKVYLVDLDPTTGAPTNKYSIEIYSDITASQTFAEQGYKRKNLHALTELYEYAVVNNANVANFSFTCPLSTRNSRLLVLGTTHTVNATLRYFDLYIQSDNVIYKVERAVVEGIAFNLEMKSILTMSISGTASKLYKFGNVGDVTIPGTLQSVASTYDKIDKISAQISGVTIDSVAAIHIDVKNDVTWYQNNTINDAIAGNMMYPGSCVLSGKTLSGSITQFLTSQNVDILSDTSTTATITINIYGSNYSQGTSPFLIFNFASAVFTRRLNFEELINRVYDFRLNTTSGTKIYYKGV